MECVPLLRDLETTPTSTNKTHCRAVLQKNVVGKSITVQPHSDLRKNGKQIVHSVVEVLEKTSGFAPNTCLIHAKVAEV